MCWFWTALGILAILGFAIWHLRLRLTGSFDQDTVIVDLRAGPFRIGLVPHTGKKKERNVLKAKKTGKSKEVQEDLPAKKFPRPTAADLRDVWQTLWPPVRRALSRTRRSIRVAPLHLSLTIGGAEEPADAAEMYGVLSALIWAGMPVLERAVDIPDPHIHIGLDFDAAQTRREGAFGISLQIGTLVAVGIGVGLPALKWLRSYLKRHQKQEAAAKSAEHPAA